MKYRELSDTIMNVVGAFLWVSVGATALHYWQGYMADHDQIVVIRERTVSYFRYVKFNFVLIDPI